MSLYTIGEFSRMSGLSVKALRLYHEKQLLVPASVEADSGYRRYGARELERAHVIAALRRLDFGLDAIGVILTGHDDDADILDYLRQHKERLADEIRHRKGIVATIDGILAQEEEARSRMQSTKYAVEEKQLEPLLVAGIRTQGRYAECGKVFGQLGRKVGRHIGGKALMLCHDDEYREDDADFEPCMPLKREVQVDGVSVRTLPGGRALTLIHAGPYDGISRSYARLLEHAKAQGLELDTPSREVYLKGPGMIFKGNPQKYLTEIQFLLR